MSLKESHYNYFFKSEDGFILAYNALSNSFARIPKEQYKITRQILKGPNYFINDSEEKDNMLKSLLKGSFVIDEDIDEIGLLKMRNKIGRFSTDYFGLTIAPTLECVFRCTYCFEKNKKESMDKRVEDALIEFVDEKLTGVKGFSVSWFGGEPLMKMDSIERLTGEFGKLCVKKNVIFSPQEIITNGYLMTKPVAKRLKELNIVKAQITIDGPPEIHNKRRKLPNGDGTFDKIIANINDAKEYINIIIRINVDDENYNEVDRLFEIFDKEGFIGKIPFYFGRVISSTDACADISSKCFSVKDFSKLIIDSLSGKKKFKPRTEYPSINHYGVCGADKFNT
jgi:uncharacterized protein